MAGLTDTHCHLNFSHFDDDRAETLMRAHQVGVTHVIVPGVTAATWSEQRRYAGCYANWFNAFGLHPYFIEQHTDDDLDALRVELEKGGAVAVGEIGLDATCANMVRQRELLSAQLKLAVTYQLPVILHHRKTLDELFQAVRRAEVKRGVVHAFSGSEQQASQWSEYGFMLGIGGVITYPRAAKTRQAVASVALDSLVLETDSPDMPVQGRQGQRNEPSCLTQVFDALCDIRSEPPQQIREALMRNTERLFRLN